MDYSAADTFPFFLEVNIILLSRLNYMNLQEKQVALEVIVLKSIESIFLLLIKSPICMILQQFFEDNINVTQSRKQLYESTNRLANRY